jgi:hypothetical protein
VRIALGLDVYLGPFARQQEAMTWRSWGSVDFKLSLLELASADDTEIRWNLTEVNVAMGLQRAAAGRPGPTDWELQQFWEHPAWSKRTRWFRDGYEVVIPAELSVTDSFGG